jgi:hypothetical protein
MGGHNDKIGDLWAVCKIRANPVKITKMEARADEAVLQAVNAWRYGDDPAAVVNETVTIRASKTAGMQGARSRAVDVDVRLEALVDGVALAGRQKVDYGGYGGMTVRMNPYVKEFSIRAVHPNPDKWRGDDLAIVQRVTDPAAFGDAAWLALYGKYPAAGVETPDFTTVIWSVTSASAEGSWGWIAKARIRSGTSSSLAWARTMPTQKKRWPPSPSWIKIAWRRNMSEGFSLGRVFNTEPMTF